MDDRERISEERRRRINSANVSEAAKEFYRKHSCGMYRVACNWGDDYAIIRELEEAGLIRTTLTYLDQNTSHTAD